MVFWQLDDDGLTPAQVAHHEGNTQLLLVARNGNTQLLLVARKERKWAVYRDGKVIIIEKRAA